MPESGLDHNLQHLIRQHLPSAMRLAVRLVGNTHDAEDLVQEAMLRAAKGLKGYRGEASFATWFTRILVNVFRTFKKRRCHSSSDFDAAGTLPDRHPDAAQAMLNTELGSTVASEVSQLPERQREVLVLIFYEGYTAAEVAEILAINVQNVYSNLNAARNTLKQRLIRLQVMDDHDQRTNTTR
jgi:RNA polymerase sigma-70 factor, ECF subfamily